jgi:hypothetical protein
LHYIYGQVPDERKGKMVSLATQTDRTLFFDFLPLDLGTISGFTTRLQLYTVPGQIYYQTTRKLVLQGADGVVFVAEVRRASSRRTSKASRICTRISASMHRCAHRAARPSVQQAGPAERLIPRPELSDALNFARPSFGRRAARTGAETLRGAAELVLKR